MDALEYKQMLEREQAVVDRLAMDLGNTEQLREREKERAFSALREAEKRMYEYACNLDIGNERAKAFDILENIRNAARVG